MLQFMLIIFILINKSIYKYHTMLITIDLIILSKIILIIIFKAKY